MKYSWFVVFIFMVRPGLAQNKSELPFIEHLINNGYFKEVVHVIDRNTYNYNKNQEDSLNFYMGWAQYSLQNLEQSTVSFLNVGKESSFYLKSRFFAGYNQTFIGDYDESRRIYGNICLENERIKSLMNFELSGIDILAGDWSMARDRLQKINPDMAIINQQVSALLKISNDHETNRSKSPFLAGVLSCLIPGSGKIYAGKTGEGVASMIATTGLGLITLENYHKLGINHFKTLFFGGIFIATYAANIYGSVVSVKIIENENKDVVHNQILFQLHVPLRNFFE